MVSKTNIVGGDFAEKNEFPWAALLHLTSSEAGLSYRCGGTLINDRSDKKQKKINAEYDC